MAVPVLNSKFSIFYAEDHLLFRETISAYINAMQDYEVIHSVENGRHLIACIQDGLIPDIVMLDLDMPDLNGYDTAKWLKINYPEIKILRLTVFDNETVRSMALAKGADAFASKDISPLKLQDILKGLTAEPATKDKTILSSGISETEEDFLKWICTDKTYEEIAKLMTISLRQIERIREVLFKKWGINNRTSLAIFAIKSGVVTR